MARRFKGRRRRRPRRRKRRRRRKGLSIRRTLLANKIALTHPFWTRQELNPPSAGTTIVHLYAGNGLTQTDITGATGQPRGFDQLAVLFSVYTVVGASIEVTFTNRSVTVADSYVCGVAAALNGSILNARDYMEGRHNNYRTMGSQQGQVKLTLNMGVAKLTGATKLLSENTLQGTLVHTNSDVFLLRSRCIQHAQLKRINMAPLVAVYA